MSFKRGSIYFLLLGFALSNISASRANPLFLLEGEPKADPRSVRYFKVLIFPHFGTYSVPQGREVSAARVRITSAQNCNVFPAKLNSQSEWEPASATAAYFGKAFDFAVGSKQLASGKVYIGMCPESFKVVRGTKLSSYAYSGSFVVYQKNARVEVVNQIEPEKYLMGVVPSEVGANWPLEALKVQAVAARTYAWWSVLVRRAADSFSYDMDDTVFYQAYLGLENQTAETQEAVLGTEKEVLTYQGQVIKSYFSADSGGYTEDALNVFEERPYCISKPELYELERVNSNWSKVVSTELIKQKLVSAGLMSKADQIDQLAVDETVRSNSGRALKVKVLLKGKLSQSAMAPLTVDAKNLRLWLGLRSTLITELKKTENGFEFTGRGYGHGVGMSQVGTLQYVQQLNWTYDQILKHYYTGIELSTLVAQ